MIVFSKDCFLLSLFFCCVDSRRFLLTPVPFQELTAMVSMVTARIWEELGCRPALFHHGGTTHKTCKPVASYVGLLTNCSQLCVQVGIK